MGKIVHFSRVAALLVRVVAFTVLLVLLLLFLSLWLLLIVHFSRVAAQIVRVVAFTVLRVLLLLFSSLRLLLPLVLFLDAAAPVLLLNNLCRHSTEIYS